MAFGGVHTDSDQKKCEIDEIDILMSKWYENISKHKQAHQFMTTPQFINDVVKNLPNLLKIP